MSVRTPLTRHAVAAAGITIVFFLGASLAAATFSIRRQAGLGEDARLRTAAGMLAEQYLACLRSGAASSDTVSKAPADTRLSILDTHGMTIADSDFAASTIARRSDDEAVRMATESGTGIATTYRMESGQRERIACVAVRASGTVIAYALAASPGNMAWTVAAETVWRLAVLLLLAAVVCCALLLLLLRAASRPLAEFADVLEDRAMDNLAGLAMHAGATDLGRATRAASSLMQEHQSLRDRERSHAAMFETVTDALRQAVAVIDANGLILSANKMFQQMFGKAARSVAGGRFAETVALPECLAAVDACMRDHGQHTVIEEDRGRTYSCTVRELEPVHTEDREFLILVEDVTDAVALPRMKADFVANASHELKTPLTAIRGYLDLLHEEPDNKHYLDIIERNVDRLIDLSSDISLLSRLENQAPSVERVDMGEIQQDLSELFDKQSRETGVPLAFAVNAEARYVRADRLMLLQMLINLIENAYRFTTVGSITVSAAVDPAHVILAVTDTGRGIAPRDLPHVFERFFSRSDDRGRMGSGLGLAIVKRIVLAHNGTIDVASAPGQGTSFVVRIPRNLDNAHTDTPAEN